MKRIDATYRVVTPMFCGGAEPERTAELRLPSFKGVLRFWWRALQWGRLGGNPRAIHREEAHLFGSAEGGQSKVLMRLKPESRPRQIAAGSVLGRDGGRVHQGASAGVVGPGARYLGYGVMGAFGATSGKLGRACLPPFEFTVQMRCAKLEPDERVSLKRALIALGTLGGMGAKSRKGYGSLALRSLLIDDEPDWEAPRSLQALNRQVAELHAQTAKAGSRQSWPDFTALSERVRHVLLAGRSGNPLDLLDLVGREMVRFRAWGFRGNVLGNVRSERNFRGDHDLMKQSAWQRARHPERIAFGLPHNYGKRGDQQVGPADSRYDRRASPLFIHIHICAGKPVAVVSFLPAGFLPARTRISVGGAKIPQESEDELYRPIGEFLNRLAGRGDHRGRARQEPFAEVREVRLP